uniref:Uncharacterized protein n=1 Tax=Haptolina brevifila TaxID=156173 RepID=A0A7S2I3I9_9EUKA|mmetsp:Transcript_60743/g.120263  ORF Transcript_60743/g.120263 Transcript_60743/m.120263 type:complete len:131 (+) Transcript_60743:275-667(+)
MVRSLRGDQTLRPFTHTLTPDQKQDASNMQPHRACTCRGHAGECHVMASADTQSHSRRDDAESVRLVIYRPAQTKGNLHCGTDPSMGEAAFEKALGGTKLTEKMKRGEAAVFAVRVSPKKISVASSSTVA